VIDPNSLVVQFTDISRGRDRSDKSDGSCSDFNNLAANHSVANSIGAAKYFWRRYY